MQRIQQFLFAISVVLLCWIAMMATHELGHVLGAWLTGGFVQAVVVHPLAISRTDVMPNPHPGLVVWLGPMFGSLLPCGIWLGTPRRWGFVRRLLQFWAGFCLIANGAYISFGSLAAIGDCGEMLRSGTPEWVMIAFGVVTVPTGLWLWHRLGSAAHFVRHPEIVSPRVAYTACVLVILVIAAASLLSNR